MKGTGLLAGWSILLVGLAYFPAGGIGVTKGHQLDKQSLAESAGNILRTNCVKCHDSTKRSGGVDLSTRASAIASSVINEREFAKSRLLREVSEGRMPPTGKLSNESIRTVREWITGGAPYPSEKLTAISLAMMPLWSFQPIQSRPVPTTPFDSLARNPIDRFVFDKLAANHLAPSRRADKLALLRRVTIDLTGLPPTVNEISAFQNDRTPNAYGKVVDRLLASTAYGERWSRHWLDVVRYGESDGYERNIIRTNAWPYRDYVIRAFNQDLPYTDFITQQLAGDVVGKGNPNIEVATGFLVAGIHDTVGNATEEGTRQKRMSDLEDITSTTCAAFLGLTVGCARCHDHKFDPIPQKDFYRLASVFSGVQFGERPIASGSALAKANLEKEILARQAFQTLNELNQLEDNARQQVLRRSGASENLRPSVNARWNVDKFPPIEAKFVRFTVLATRDGTEPCLDELQIYSPSGSSDLALSATGAKATASGLFPGSERHKISHLNDGLLGNDHSWISNTRNSGWAQIELPQVHMIDRVSWSRDGAEVARYDDRLPTQYRIDVSLEGTTWKAVSTEVGRDSRNGLNYIHPEAFQKAMTRDQKTRREHLQRILAGLSLKNEDLSSRLTAYVGQFTNPEPTFVLRRGDPMQRMDQVSPGAISQITSLDPDLCPSADAPDPVRRLALAKWIGNDRNPLSARVIVNRIWQYHFGKGIVGTPSDFGRNGEKPSHPELLDWLAHDFMANGWRMKRLHRMIVTSTTYCQSGESNAKGQQLDASNRLLWHMPLRRMEAEALRDAILATSGQLNRRMGGPGFRLFNYTELNVASYDQIEQYSPDTWRRSIYRVPARAIRDDLLETFDCPESAQREPKRATTTTALQALSLLNGNFLIQQAGFYAERVVRDAGKSLDSQVTRAFQLALGRVPEALEKRAALRLASRQGLKSLCRGLMNANEFVYY